MVSFKFKSSFQVGHKLIGRGHPCLIIAEAGVSHFGDFQKAIELVNLACAAKADVFKIQIFNVDELFADIASDWKDRLRPRNLSFEETKELKNYAESKGLIFVATAHDESRIEWLKKLDVAAIKIGSGERNNPSFIRKLAQLGKPMILSTGMYDLSDIEEAKSACADAGCSELAILHCVTSYPTPDESINLASIDALKKVFCGPIGYSDHSKDGLPILGGVAMGASIIERHITIEKNIPNAQDWKVSSDWDDFHVLIKNIRRIEKMIGKEEISIQAIEEEGLSWALKSLFLKKDLNAGHVLESNDFIAQRPGGGIKPSELDKIIGKKLIHNINKGEMLSWKNIER